MKFSSKVWPCLKGPKMSRLFHGSDSKGTHWSIPWWVRTCFWGRCVVWKGPCFEPGQNKKPHPFNNDNGDVCFMSVCSWAFLVDESFGTETESKEMTQCAPFLISKLMLPCWHTLFVCSEHDPTKWELLGDQCKLVSFRMGEHESHTKMEVTPPSLGSEPPLNIVGMMSLMESTHLGESVNHSRIETKLHPYRPASKLASQWDVVVEGKSLQ